MAPSLLDSDMLSEIFKQKNAIVVRNAVAYLQSYGQFTFSTFTRYEVIRGLKSKGASRQLLQFANLCRHSQVLPLPEAVFDRAADLWVSANAIGQPQKDADLLIAATAMENGLTLVTGNTKDFSWITGLILEDWRQP